MVSVWGNPIFRREFRANARSGKTLALAGLLVGALMVMLVLLWPRTGVLSESNGGEIFSIFLNVNLAMVVLLIPGLAATTITQERENRSFDLLSTSLLSPVDIMVGKLTASLCVMLMVVMISLPVTAICALSGGISIPLLVKVYSVILLSTLTYGLMALALSALCHRSFTSLAMTYVGILVLAGGTWLPSVLLPNLVGMRGVWHVLRSISPFEALFALNHPEHYRLSVSGMSPEAAYAFFLRGAFTLSALFLVLFCYRVLRPPRKRGQTMDERYADRRTAIKRKLMFPFYLIDPLKRKKPVARWRNPVFVAEIRSRIFGHPKFIIRSLSACVVLSLMLLTMVATQYATQLDPDRVRVVAIIFQMGVVAFFAPAVCSGSITDERTGGTLIHLRMTGMPIRTIVAGKVKAGFLYVLIFLVSSLPVLWALNYLEIQQSVWRLAAWMGVLILTTVVFTIAGLCASTVVATTGAATVTSYAFSAIICLGTLGVLLFGSRVSPHTQAFVLSFNPLVAALQITSDTWFSHLPRLFGNRLWHNNLIFLGIMAVVLLAVTAVRVRHIVNHRV